MQPTAQSLVPFSFYSGQISGSDLTIDLNDSYDHIITWLSLGAGPVGSGYRYAILGSPINGEIWATEVVADSGGNYGVQVPLWIVLQQLGTVSFTSNLTDPWLGVYGYRLNPPGATLYGV